MHHRRCLQRQQRRTAATTAAALLLLLLACAPRPCAAFHEGEFLHTSKRSQYAKMRTAWRDLTEHHCPRFGRPHMVVLPIYEPTGVPGPVTDYRVQLSFDGDRTLTPWVRVIGARAVPPGGVPLVRVVLSRAGGELRAARADVIALPQGMLADADAAQLAAAYHNASHWPKHVPVAYEWRADPDASLERGAYVMLCAGLAAALAVAAGNLAGLRGRAAAFLRDVAGDAPGAADPLLPPGVLEAFGGGGGGGVAPMRAVSGGLHYGSSGGAGSGYYGGGIGIGGGPQRSGSLGGYEPAMAPAAAGVVAVGGVVGGMSAGLAARTSAGGVGVGGGGGYAAYGGPPGGQYSSYQYSGYQQQAPPMPPPPQQQQQQQPQYGYPPNQGGWPPPRKTGAHAD